MSQDLQKWSEVARRTTLSRSTIRELVKKGQFPKPVPVGTSGFRSGFVKSEVDAWIDACIAARERGEAALSLDGRRKRREGAA